MEEKAIKKEAQSPKMVAVDAANEQLQKVMKQADTQFRQLAAQAQQMEQMLRDKTIDHLFSVLKYSSHFDLEFTEKCAEVITAYLTQVALEKQEPQETTEETGAKEEKTETIEE